MRVAFLIPIALLAACSSDKPADDTLVTLDGSDGAAPAATPGTVPIDQPGGAIQAVTAEGSKLEPLLSSAISAAGLESGACRFSPAQGALPVVVASRTDGHAILSVGGKQIDLAPGAVIKETGGGLSGQGISMAVASGVPMGGTGNVASPASMQINDADGPAFTYKDGFWVCN